MYLTRAHRRLGGLFSTLDTFRRIDGAVPVLTNGTWSVASQAVFLPIQVNTPCYASMLFIHNVVPSGLVQLGLYDSDDDGRPGSLIAATEIALHTGPAAVQFLPVSTSFQPYVPRGLVFMAAVVDNATATIQRVMASTYDGASADIEAPASATIRYGAYIEQNAFPLPVIATPAEPLSTLNIPILGFEGGDG